MRIAQLAVFGAIGFASAAAAHARVRVEGGGGMTMRINAFAAIILTLGVFLVMPTPAGAVPVYTLQNSASAVAGGDSSNQDTGVLVNQPAPSLLVSASVPGESALATATAAPGVLGALAMVISNSSSLGGATANATAAFSDTLTILGSGQVTLGVALDVTGLLSGCAVCAAQASVSSSLSVPGGDAYLNNIGSVSYGRSFVGGTSNLTPSPVVPTIVVTVTGGNELSLVNNVSVFAGTDGLGNFATADFSSTARVFVDVLTPGASFVSASGATYARVASVPAPSTIGLVVAALLCAGVLVRRHG